MKKENFIDIDVLIADRNREQHLSEGRSSLTFLTFWPNVNDEYFRDNLLKNYFKNQQLIHSACCSSCKNCIYICLLMFIFHLHSFKDAKYKK
jgi:hypothetical protein